MFVGYPGAGKTTVARIITELTGGVHLWADFERHVMFDSPSHTHAESRQLYQHLNHVADELLSKGSCVIYDTNFNFRKDRDHMRNIAAKYDADVKVIWITTPRNIAEHRATQDSVDKPTRIWGNMSPTDFNRLSDNLQTPDDDEEVIKIDGRQADLATIKQALGL
jgi:predicted kinase